MITIATTTSASGWRNSARRIEFEELFLMSSERVSAFNAGYSDGFHDADMWAGNERGFHPDVYRAAYEAGIEDRTVKLSIG